MANVDRVNGFTPVGSLGGRSSGTVRRYSKAAGTTVTHDLFIGDIVKLSGTGNADGVQGVLLATAGDTPCGVIVGFDPLPDDGLHRTWVDGASAAIVHVDVDPNCVMEVQCDDVLPTASVGLNGDLVQTSAGSRTTGRSGQEFDIGTVDTTSTLVFQILGLVQKPDNTINSANNKALVTFNVHQFGSVGTDGV